MLRIAPGADTTPKGVQAHEFWEEVYILEGSFTDLTLGTDIHAPACTPAARPACRTDPGAPTRGVTTFEVPLPKE